MHTATVLVIDGGGRGAVLVKKYLVSRYVSKVYCLPGNDLMLLDKNVRIYPDIKTTDIANIRKIVKGEKIDLVDVAQDDAVAKGLVDALIDDKVKVIGPTRLAGQIEWDKAWARNFMRDFKIPSPEFKVSKSQREAISFIKAQKENEWFVKASGLAAGKGALYAQNNQEAIECIGQMSSFGKAGETFLIEECLAGEEFSSFAIVDGENFIIIGHAQDHKPVFDGNLGPNTGGMGCSSPPMVITADIERQIESIIKKTTEVLVRMKRPYRGILYLGGMIDQKRKVYVIEFNARWGDPEAQVIVPAIKDDFYQLAMAAIEGRLNELKIKKDNYYRVVVTAASQGYPDDYSQTIGKQIFGLDQIMKSKDVEVFGAGVKIKSNKFLAGGGRLFYVMAHAKNVAQARKIAYNALSLAYIEDNNLHFRTDIGYRDLERYYKLPRDKSPRYGSLSLHERAE